MTRSRARVRGRRVALVDPHQPRGRSGRRPARCSRSLRAPAVRGARALRRRYLSAGPMLPMNAGFAADVILAVRATLLRASGPTLARRSS